jgi:hypothetical protein
MGLGIGECFAVYVAQAQCESACHHGGGSRFGFIGCAACQKLLYVPGQLLLDNAERFVFA